MKCPALFAFSAVMTMAFCSAAQGTEQTSDPNRPAWQLLLANKPDEAKKIFSANTSLADKALAGEAYRGLAESARFLGDDEEACRDFFTAYQKDDDALAVSSDIVSVIQFSRSAWAAMIKEGYNVLERLTKKNGLLTGHLLELLSQRYLNDGEEGKAIALTRKMGCILNWQFIGPFDNISHSGYNTAYPPETEIDFSKSYIGKDGNRVKWDPLVSAPTSGWIFVEDHTAVSNAINYFYCSVKSPVDREALLSFGASGMFKVFLNGAAVIADSLFRNTGADMFMQRVKLFKGENTLLIKLGHERGHQARDGVMYSNFSVRFLDLSYAPLSTIAVSTDVAKPSAARPVSGNIRPQPIMDTVVAVLSGRMKNSPGNVDAALLLMHFYNGTEMSDECQKLVRAWITLYPHSALLHHLLYESLGRAKKYTEAQTEAKLAYTLAPMQYDSWAIELATVARSGDAQQVLQFIDTSSPLCRNSFLGEYQKLKAYIQLENRNAILECIARLEDRHADDPTAVSILASTFVEQGNTRKAKKVIEDYLKHDETSTSLYQALAQIALKSGETAEAEKTIKKGLVYTPVDANAYFYLARLALYAKDYARAKKMIDRTLAIMPAGASALNLKGSILEAMNEKSGAAQAYNDAITYTNDNFNAWDNLRSLNNKPGLDSLAPLPEVPAVLQKSRSWDKRASENGAILSYIDDVFYYPNKCSKERQFLMVCLGTQRAIDNWKEYTCGYNGNFQTCAIARALSIKADGRQVPADIDGAEVVFKTLQPGDCIVLEWTLKNYYSGGMAKQVWGEHFFQMSYPVFDQQLRFITPVNDTVPYAVYGDSLSVASKIVGDYRIVTVTRPASSELLYEKFRASDWAACPKVTYSTFTSWTQIVDWYTNLTAHIQDNTLEVDALADSLFLGAPSPLEKIMRIHRYITNTIRYSYVSFRQSGWIPQPANDVVATRIGDCKDMASLGKILFEKAGIRANLVLTNTAVRMFPDHAYIGPNFNHCILSYERDGAARFIDFTDNASSVNTLPYGDQAAMALVIAPGTTAPRLLPLDSAASRSIVRTVVSSIDEKGNYAQAVGSIRTGIYASGYRYDYRPESQEKRVLRLHEILAREYQDVTVDSFSVRDVDSLSDSLQNYYAFHAKNALSFSGATALFSYHLPDALAPEDYPTEEKRHTPLDMTTARCGIGSQVMHAELTFPKGWKPITLPEKTAVHSKFGDYQMTFAIKGNTISCDRKAVFTAYRCIEAGEYGAMKDFLNTISKADALQLVFMTK